MTAFRCGGLEYTSAQRCLRTCTARHTCRDCKNDSSRMNFHEVAFTYAQAFRTPARPSLSGFLTGAGAVFKFLRDFPRALSFVGAPPFPRTSGICECGRICKVVPRNASMVLMIYRSCRASGEQRKAVLNFRTQIPGFGHRQRKMPTVTVVF